MIPSSNISRMGSPRTLPPGVARSLPRIGDADLAAPHPSSDPLGAGTAPLAEAIRRQIGKERAILWLLGDVLQKALGDDRGMQRYDTLGGLVLERSTLPPVVEP